VKTIRILPAARHDLVDGFHFYEMQAEGIGRYFLDTLYSDIESLRINAGVHPLSMGSYHRLLSKRFPYSIYYRVEENSVLIYAILDNRRNPEWIKKRIEKDRK